MESITIKRGQTLSIVGTYKENGTATTIAPYTVRSQARDSLGALVTDWTITKDPDQTTNPGKFVMVPVTPTGEWPLDAIKCDIEFVQGDNIRPFPTFEIIVTEKQTRV